MRIGDEFAVRLTGMAHGGAALGRHENRVVFVRHGIPGESVLVEVTGLGPKGRYAEARLLEVLEASPDRREHPWPAADALLTLHPVGGMEYGHIRPERQRLLKADVLREQLVRLGGMDPADPLLEQLTVVDPAALADPAVLAAAGSSDRQGHSDPEPSGAHGGWRTRVHFAVDDEGRPGMHPYHEERVIPVERFPLAVREIQELGLGAGRFPGVSRIDVAAPSAGAGSASRPLILFTAAPDTQDLAPLGRELDVALDACPADVEVSAVLQPARIPGRRGPRPQPIVLRGDDHVVETLPVPSPDRPDAPAPLRFRVGAGGFWQNHRLAPAALTETVRQLADVRPADTVWDLYGGAGLFAALAADQVGAGGTVWSVEGSPVTSGAPGTIWQDRVRPAPRARGGRRSSPSAPRWSGP
ncbi:TRAM domain-containing protein [Rothia kristinae]|uniref:TRAM domain-containing protein n=1 Tax=Rothia kristinae TaxID=37923 RepID=UPI0018CA3154|nr:class I SAM-dependent RNA methyltransferase [Rothia kristinae]